MKRAHAVLQPVSDYIALHGKLPENAPIVAENESLSNLIHLAIDEDIPIVVNDNGTDIGVVTRKGLLKTVIEGTEVS